MSKYTYVGGGKNSFKQFLTPEQAMKVHNELNPKSQLPLSYWRKLARSKRKCLVCGDDAWRWGQCGLCFSCTTGESDASDDYELIPG